MTAVKRLSIVFEGRGSKIERKRETQGKTVVVITLNVSEHEKMTKHENYTYFT